MYEIEKNIAIPNQEYRGRKRGESKYPIAKMEVGDSFLIPAKKGARGKICAMSTAYGAVATAKKWMKAAGDTTREFTVRTVEGGARIWRTK